jgi:DNA-binding MarR family transcriptional regulator
MHATVSHTETADDTLVASLGGFMKYLLHHTGRDFYAVIGELELSISQIRMLHLLTFSRPEASVKQLADEIGLSMPAASRSVDALVHRGLVTRSENTEDRRLKTVRATDDARVLVDRMIEMRVAGLADFVSTLSPRERTKLAAALSPIVARDEIAPLCRGAAAAARKESDA